MKKYLRLLGAITIFIGATPSVIAAAPYQPQAKQAKKISENSSHTNIEILEDINDKNVDDESYFINSTAQEIKTFKNKDQSFSFIKKIKDIFDNELYYIQYEQSNAIVYINNYETIEISNDVYDEEKFNNEIVYIPSVGLVYKENNQLYSIEEDLVIEDGILPNILLMKNNYNYFLESNKIENKKTRDLNFEKYNKEIKIRKKRSYKGRSQSSTYANNIRVSHEVPHSWWFRKLDSSKRLGYAETENNKGLCEYIALSMLILYQELFVSSGYLTNSEIEKYFEIPNNSTWDISEGLMEHKYHQYNQADKSFVRKLWNLNNQVTDIKTGKTISNALNQFSKYKSINGRYNENWSTSWLHKSSPEDLLLSKQIPVMLSFVYYAKNEKKYGGHNIIVYGYDRPSRKFLVNYGWSGIENSQRLLSKSLVWSYFSMGYWYALYHKDNTGKLPLKKLFSYNSRKYTSLELKEMGVI